MSVTQHRAGCVLLRQEDVPERWRTRAVPVMLVTLLPEETSDLLAGASVVPELDPEDERLARLVVRGATADSMARALNVTPRTAYRRLARLRDRLGVSTTAELVNRLAHQL